MNAIDTNVLVRYLVNDDERQSALVAGLVERAVIQGREFFVSDIVVCETVWVLSFSYRIPRADIAALLRDVFRARHLQFAASDQLLRALEAYQAGNGDFADYLIREHARHAGCSTVSTFDKALLKEVGFAPVK